MTDKTLEERVPMMDLSPEDRTRAFHADAVFMARSINHDMKQVQEPTLSAKKVLQMAEAISIFLDTGVMPDLDFLVPPTPPSAEVVNLKDMPIDPSKVN